jgi:hypothetical protein
MPPLLVLVREALLFFLSSMIVTVSLSKRIKEYEDKLDLDKSNFSIFNLKFFDT